MKKVNEILTHLKYNPNFKKINTNSTIERLINLLPLKLKKGIKFTYVKRQILFFVLTHPVYKAEFEYNKSLIKSLLKSANIANIDDVNFFVTNRIEKKEEIMPLPNPSFKERSHAIFENFSQNERHHELFEQIRTIIKTKS